MAGAPCVHHLVERRVSIAPDAVAILDGEQRVSYRELDARANQLAHDLCAAGVSIETLVGVCCDPSAEMIVAVLAVLKAGGAYVPIDPAYPADRITWILDDARPAVVITDGAVDVPGPVIRIDAPRATPTTAPRVALTDDHALYVLYTSGSTGRPKGVVGVHRAITSRLAWADAVHPYADGEIACTRTPLGFVDSVAEIFAPLAAGVPLVIIGRDARRDPTRMVAQLAAERVTRIVVVPSLLATLFALDPDLGDRLPRLRWWFVGGEPVPVPLVERFTRAMPGRKLINIYGATEVSGDATWFDFDRMPPGLATSPIGTPLPGVHVRLLDEHLREAEVGEVCVSGVCLAREYLRRPDLTAARFVPNPFPEGGRMYRMGDVGRRLPTGDLQYLGRIDHQVKIRGMRVELGEVEARLAEVPGVTAAVAVARDDGHGGRTLVAYYTASAPRPSPTELRAHLARRLPDFMVPTRLLPLAELPLGASRKVDRRALADRPLPAAADFDPPATDAERRIARAWEDVLAHAPIGRSDSFYDLGGTSLSAVRIIARLRDELGRDIPLDAIFAHPTIAALAAHLGRGHGAAAAARPAPDVSGRPLPAELSLGHYQFPFWFFRALTGDVSVVSEVFAFTAPIDVERLQRAFSTTVAAFDTLWMRYPRWRAVQRPAPRRACRFTVRDHRAASDATAALAEEAAANGAAPFALTAPPHVHARLVLLPGGDQRLVVAMPHIAVDMTAMELFRARLEQAYAGVAPPPAPAATLLDLVEWERRPPAGLAADAGYWRDLAGADPWNPIPARLCATKLAGRRARALGRRALDPDVVAGVTAYARRHASSLPIALVASITAGLRAVTGRDELTLLLMIEKRDRAELRELFTTMTGLMPFRARGAATLAELVAHTGAQLMTSYAHTDHLMRVPTLWNDAWARAPRVVRRAIERLSARNPLVARYLFAIVPYPRRRSRDREIMVAVNIMPEVYQPAPAGAGVVRVIRARTVDLILRPDDVVIGADALLDRTLQVHVTREHDRVVVNLYGGGIDQAGLDELAARIADAMTAIAALGDAAPVARGA